ncbi:methyltransferase [Flexivirga endophytica]|uniref:Methyltransferase n=1 Tax=Flexivirga endophytica TaxID=1849103 RepID=A0A916X1D6_9MICO|nr:class I SAM-dependent methyltransferase [Flexivirga endophytica]GGB46740.1 methyltransferase [Flexivirga endophytica]GHB70795.1 methyltransferase [Flexivirga endophytica]
MRAPDAGFADPRLAVLYDFFDDDRSDLDGYEAIIDEFGARKVIDVGCGTGSLAVRLAARDLEVIGVDPAVASVDVARAKPYADRVTWLKGDATALTGRVDGADLAVMVGNVAQVFVDDVDWSATLGAIHGALRDGGWLVFETRRPEMRAWEHWTTPPTEVVLPDGRRGTDSMTVTEVALPLVTFESTLKLPDETLRSVSTLRFRERAEIEDDLRCHGFKVVEVRDAPDRPGKEWVFFAQVLRE